MYTLSDFIGLENLPSETHGAVKRYMASLALMVVLFNLSGTIFVLHIIDGVGFAAAAMVMALMALTQVIIDYPSGGLGDYMGQRWVLLIALGSHAIASYLFAVVYDYTGYVIVGIIFGFSFAQQSGALNSWFDNNYVATDDHDPERLNYGYTMNRIGTLNTALMGLAILIGGFMATSISRGFVFKLQAILSIVVAIGLYFMVTDSEEAENKRKSQARSIIQYMQTLKQGLQKTISDRAILIFVLGNSIIGVAWALWGSLMLFPIYFGYTGSDALAGSFRSIIFFTGVGIQFMLSSTTKKMKKKHLPVLLFLHFGILFTGMSLIISKFPLLDTFNLVALILTYCLLVVAVSVLSPLFSTLISRISLDTIPSEYRNSIYSLMPSVSGSLQFILLPVIGSVIEIQGFTTALMIMLGIAIGGIAIFSLNVWNLGINTTRTPEAIIVAGS